MKVIQFVLLFATTINLVLTANIQPRSQHDDVDNILNDVTDQAHDVTDVESRLYGGVMKERVHGNKQLESRDNTELERRENSDVLEVVDGAKVEGSSVNLATDVLSQMKGLQSRASDIKKKKWSKGTFTKALKELGIFKVKGLKVVKMKKNDIDVMRRAKDGIKMVRAKKPRRKVDVAKKADQPESVRRDDIDEHDANTISKRTSGYDLCQEYVDTMYVLAHDSSQLAYQVESVRCEGMCYSSTFRMNLGSCNLATKSMVVYIIDNNGNFVPQSIEPGCACECLHYNN